ncbi:hypothetical protein HY251_21375 [bacterium]|nr:hypothetical protein [bacterium]
MRRSIAVVAAAGAVAFSLALERRTAGEDYSGTWRVAGEDPVHGAFSGTAVVAASGEGMTVERLVTFAKRLPDGRELISAWNATAKKSSKGLEVSVSLRRADAYKRVGHLRRTEADKEPLLLRATLAASGKALAGTFVGAAGEKGPTETWTPSNAAAPPFPRTDRKSFPLHKVDEGTRESMFRTYSDFHALADVAPYASRPEFKRAQHFCPVDHTAKDFYRERGPTCVVVLDKVQDEISIAEERARADAFSYRLCEKARRCDADMKNIHLLRCGMIAAVDTASGQHWVSGDGALYQGVWVESQVFRWLVTRDAEALGNVELGTRALVTMAEISSDRTGFARALEDGSTRREGFVKGTGKHADTAWLPGGNNDMLHGLECGFFAAETVLPAGHPLRAEIGAQARSLLESVKISRRGTHRIFLARVAWKTTGDAELKARYEEAIGPGSAGERKLCSLGQGILQMQGITDWSGHHLALVDLIGLHMLGGSSPSDDERAWREAATAGAKKAFANVENAREGLLAVVAGACGDERAKAAAKDILEEIPYPKPIGDAEIDLRVSKEFCMSPYPANPWKLDWTTNPGREQAIEGHPHFMRGSCDNYWNEGTLDFLGWVSEMRFAPQDYLHAYWLARLGGVIGPDD